MSWACTALVTIVFGVSFRANREKKEKEEEEEEEEMVLTLLGKNTVRIAMAASSTPPVKKVPVV